MQTVLPPRRTLEFGIYRDGDNNLDAIQESVVAQALAVTGRDSRIACTVEDTTHRGVSLETDSFDVADGRIAHARAGAPSEMSAPKTLAAFVAHTLDEAQARGTRQTWIELVDHGGGDGGGLETSDGRVMPMPEIAEAIADGVAMHARAHPEDAGRGVDGVVANQCLMATMGFTDALSRAGVKYLAASPETMIAPGVPTNVAHAIAQNESDPQRMAQAVVDGVMGTRYDAGPLGSFGPAAAFDVLDCAPKRVATAKERIRSLDDALVRAANDPGTRRAIRADVGAVDGMARLPNAQRLPWRADRPAIAVYDRIAADARLGANVRSAARAASDAVRGLVLAHAESARYRDATGPTVHAPVTRRQIDPWAPRVSETENAFYRDVDAPALTRAIA